MATSRRRSTAEELLSGTTSLSGQNAQVESGRTASATSGTTGTGRVTEEKNYNEHVDDRDKAEDKTRPSVEQPNRRQPDNGK